MKLKRTPIDIVELEEYLADTSDFAFELRILEMLAAKGISCEHGGQYRDPDTQKFREFDLRTRVTKGIITLAAAIECKSIGKHFPLLVSCVPRNEAEAYHQVFTHVAEDQVKPGGIFDLQNVSVLDAKVGFSITSSQLYPIGEPVGKSTAQVGRRDTKEAELVANDAEFFEKWSQALQSLDDLVSEIADKDFIEERWNRKLHISLALPIVVVPNETLWAVSYTKDGKREGPPARTDRISIYIGRTYQNRFPGDSLDVTHLEVMTESGLANFVDTYLKDADAMRAFISRR